MKRFPPHRGRNILRSALDRIADRFGYIPKAQLDGALVLEGHVYVQVSGKEEIYLGQNIITERMSAHVAGLIAATDFTTYIGSPTGGFKEGDPVFPVELVIGTGTVPAAKTDIALDEPILTPSPGLAEVVYPLDRILVYQDPSSYGTDPIAVSFFFEIPSGESYDDGAGGSTNNLTIQEWGLRDAFGGMGGPRLLARKVATISKLSELDLTVRWEIRT